MVVTNRTLQMHITFRIAQFWAASNTQKVTSVVLACMVSLATNAGQVFISKPNVFIKRRLRFFV
tara:strand:- start:810 stop:1001 length:192 start_codon:yes stop_codon:yes gene_type:complete